MIRIGVYSQSMGTHLHLVGHNGSRAKLGANFVRANGIKITKADGRYFAFGLQVLQVA